MIHAVKILSDSGSGQFSWFTLALDWIVSNGERPAIVSASLGGGGNHNFVKVAVDRTVQAGVVVVVAAGNDRANACGFTPAYILSTINVGATQSNDQRAGFSNYGQCLDIFAPGVNIISAGHQSNSATAQMQGTSMACPHVAGAAALVLQKEPNLMPNVVAQRLLSSATKNIVTSPQGSPNNFLYVDGGSQAPSTTPAECKDLHWKCPIKWQNKCHKERIAEQCPLTCGKCDGGTQTTLPPGACKDNHHKCTTKWKDRCHREKVQQQCPLTCGICTNP